MIEKYNLYRRTFFIAFWLMQCFGFIAEEILPPLNVLRSTTFLLCDMVFFLLGILCLIENRDKGDNIVFFSFIAISCISTLFINREGLLMLFNGMRDFLGLIFVIPIFRYFFNARYGGKDFIKTFDKHLFIYLCIQAVCITWQFIKYGANDHGGGSMGNGASGLASTCIYFASYYLMTKRWDSALSYGANLWKNRILIFLLYPSFLNETKISFIFLICYFLLLLKIDKTAVRKFLIAIPALIGVLAIVFPIYLDVTDQDADRVLSKEFFDEYLLGGQELDRMVEVALMIQDEIIVIDETDLWSVDIPRFTKILWLPQTLESADGGMTFGAGLGQFKGGSSVKMSKFAQENQWGLLGSRPWMFFVIVQIGVIGFIWYILSVYHILNFKHNSYDFAKNIKIYLSVILLLILFYNESLRSFQFCSVIFYIILFASTTFKVSDKSKRSLSNDAYNFSL